MNLPVGPSGHLFYVASRPVFQARVHLGVAPQPRIIFQRPGYQGWNPVAADPWLHLALQQMQMVWMTALFNQLNFITLASMMEPLPRFRDSGPSHERTTFKAHADAPDSTHRDTPPAQSSRQRASASRSTAGSHRTAPDGPSAPQADSPPAAGQSSHEEPHASYKAPPQEPSPEYRRDEQRMTPLERRQYLQELGFSADSSPTDSEIKKAYRTLALKYHPDRTAELPEQERTQATEKFKAVADAYEALLNPDKQPAAAA